MKKIVKVVILLFLFFFCIVNISFGQSVEENKEVRNFLNEMFQPLNKSKIPYGLLKDYAFELTDLDKFTGSALTDNNCVDRQTYELLLRSIRSSAVATKPFGDVFEILTKQYSLGDNNTISLSGLAYQFSVIKENAVANGLIRYEGEKVYDNTKNGIWQDPYETNYAIGFCAHDSIFRGRSFTFKLDQSCWFSNLALRKIEIDPGIGSYLQISIGTPFSVNYSSSGTKELKLRITLSNGVQLYSHSRIEVKYAPMTKSAGIMSPVTITGDGYNGAQTKAEVTVRTRNGKLINPLIVVEGFDPRVSPAMPNGMGSFQVLDSILNKAEAGLSDKIISKNFDLVYVDWVNSEDYMQANANTLIKVIEWVNQQKEMSKSNMPNIILGQSMGGVIVRYALKTMENKNIKHGCAAYISLDAPHLGANVPLGVLYGLYGTMSFLENKKIIGGLVNKKGNTGTLLEIAERIVHSNAARQMLVNYVDFGGYLNNSLHDSWQKELAELGFPQGDKGKQFKMSAIANGGYSNNVTASSYLDANFSASSDILNLPVLSELSSVIIGVGLEDLWSGLLNLLPGKSTIKGSFQINPGTAAGAKITEIQLKYMKKLLWTVDISRTVFSYRQYMPGGLAYDIFPSSTFSIDKKSIDGSRGEKIPVIGKFNYNINVATSIPFVPTSSALCVGAGKSTLTQSMFTSRPNIAGTPFGANYWTPENMAENHAQITETSLQWIATQISTAIIGAPLGSTGSKYSLMNERGVVSGVKWSTSDNTIATVNNEGVLTVYKRGLITIVAIKDGITSSMNIASGIPRFVLDEVVREPGYYRIRAKCIDTEKGYADYILNSNSIMAYQWGVKSGNDAIKWTFSYSPEVRLSTLEEKENTTIYLRTIDFNKNVSNPIFVRVAGYDIYEFAMTTLIFNKQGELYDASGNNLPYEYMSFPFDLKGTSYEQFQTAKWNPVAAVIINDENDRRGIEWYGNESYVKYIVTPEDRKRILLFPDNKVVVYTVMLLNYDGEIVQKTPVSVMYKANFPSK